MAIVSSNLNTNRFSDRLISAIFRGGKKSCKFRRKTSEFRYCHHEPWWDIFPGNMLSYISREHVYTCIGSSTPGIPSYHHYEADQKSSPIKKWVYCSYKIFISIFSDRNSGRQPSVHQKGEHEQGAIMCHNSLGVIRMSRWNLPHIRLPRYFMFTKISAISSHNFKRHSPLKPLDWEPKSLEQR